MWLVRGKGRGGWSEGRREGCGVRGGGGGVKEEGRGWREGREGEGDELKGGCGISVAGGYSSWGQG